MPTTTPASPVRDLSSQSEATASKSQTQQEAQVTAKEIKHQEHTQETMVVSRSPNIE